MARDNSASWLCRTMILVAVAIGLPAHAQSVTDVFKRVKDSVVVIRTSERGTSSRPGVVPVIEQGLGSGVLVDKDRVLTAAHVVQVAETIVVQLPGGEAMSASVVASEPSADIALLRLERVPMNPAIATLGDSGTVEVGDEVLVIGAPLGMTHSLSVGHVSARRTVNNLYGGFSNAELLQTDAAVHPGNSGGPMFDMNGHVIGIVSHLIFGEAGDGGLGFVVTSNMAKDLLLSGKGTWTGMEGYVLEGDLARIFQLPQARGILVQRIAKDSPAAKIGLQGGQREARIGDETFLVGGDVILSVQEIGLAEPGAPGRIRDAIASFPAGKPVTVVVLRGGRRIELEWIPPAR